MDLRITPHARQRMHQRSITEDDIRHAIENATSKDVTPTTSIRYRGPGVNGRSLKVWTVPDDPDSKTKVIKSAAWEE